MKPTKPDFCPYIYRDAESLFLEFEGQVLRFTFTEGGLSKALKHIPNITHVFKLAKVLGGVLSLGRSTGAIVSSKSYQRRKRPSSVLLGTLVNWQTIRGNPSE